MVGRVTVADGWPRVRPQGFPPPPDPAARDIHLAGPGLLCVYYASGEKRPPYEAAASAAFAGRTWRAMQPTDFRSKAETPQPGEAFTRPMTWSGLLAALDAQSFVEAAPNGGGPPVRYTRTDGLAGNIVTHLAAAGGSLWAACADIYDPEKEAWGAGGLSRFDPQAGRWERVAAVGGRPVRWVTLLEAAGDDLWIGFREGDGVAGDKIYFGMGIYVGRYQPLTRAVALARLAGGQWTVFARDPVPEAVDPPEGGTGARQPGEPPTEAPRKLACLGDRVFLFSQVAARGGYGGWNSPQTGCISMLAPAAGRWRIFDAEKDFGANAVHDMIAEGGELFAVTDRGLCRWSAERWTTLETGSPVRNPAFRAAVAVGEELWVGYTNQAFGVLGEQGISRYDEKRDKWSWSSPQEIGTGCPVRTIVPAGDGGAWVLFHRRPWGGAASEMPRYRGEAWGAPAGLGRFAEGRWQFPATLPGVPRTFSGQYKDEKGVHSYTMKAPIKFLVQAAGRLFVANLTGAYERPAGPEEWKRVADGDVGWMGAAADGRALEIVRYLRPNGEVSKETQYGRYDLASGKVEFKTLDPQSPDWGRFTWLPWGEVRPGETGAEPAWADDWTELPRRGPDAWAVGDLQTDSLGGHRVVETPEAVWILSEGELIRLDRARCAKAQAPL